MIKYSKEIKPFRREWSHFSPSGAFHVGLKSEQFDSESPEFRGPGAQSDDLKEGAVVRWIITERLGGGGVDEKST